MTTLLPPGLRRRLREGFATCAELLFSSACAGCGADQQDLGALCLACRVTLERRAPPWCDRCGEPALAGQPCPDDHRTFTGMAFYRAPLRYRGTGARLVHRLKFSRDLGAGHFLSRAMGFAVAPLVRTHARRALVVPVPRHRAKLRAERFDPATWLARQLADRLELVFLPRGLERTRATLPQADPRVTNRESNVEGAFACPAPWAIAGRTILLVDDVLTSGATARACARALREGGGASNVLVVTGARA